MRRAVQWCDATPGAGQLTPVSPFNRLKKRDEDGKYEIELSYPHAYPVLKLCSVVETRSQLEKAFNSRYAGEFYCAGGVCRAILNTMEERAKI